MTLLFKNLKNRIIKISFNKNVDSLMIGTNYSPSVINYF